MKKWSDITPRKRDALVAEKVMDWDVYTHARPHPLYALDDDEVAIGFPPDEPSQGDWDVPYEIEDYTTSISAAWKVVDKMDADGWRFDLSTYEAHTESIGTDFCQRDGDGLAEARAKTAPEAICLAALRAVGVDI